MSSSTRKHLCQQHARVFLQRRAAVCSRLPNCRIFMSSLRKFCLARHTSELLPSGTKVKSLNTSWVISKICSISSLFNQTCKQRQNELCKMWDYMQYCNLCFFFCLHIFLQNKHCTVYINGGLCLCKKCSSWKLELSTGNQSRSQS